LQTRFDWVCTWAMINKCNSFTSPSTGLSGTQYSTLNSAGINASMIPKDQKNITLKWSTGQRFTAATQHLIPAVVMYKNLETKWSLKTLVYMCKIKSRVVIFYIFLNCSCHWIQKNIFETFGKKTLLFVNFWFW
jgi:hypothetical protein